MAQAAVVKKDAARTDPARSAYRMTSVLSLSSSPNLSLGANINIQSTAELTNEERALTGLGAFLVDEDYRRNLIGSVVKEDLGDLAVLKEYVVLVAKKRATKDKAWQEFHDTMLATLK